MRPDLSLMKPSNNICKICSPLDGNRKRRMLQSEERSRGKLPGTVKSFQASRSISRVSPAPRTESEYNPVAICMKHQKTAGVGR